MTENRQDHLWQVLSDSRDSHLGMRSLKDSVRFLRQRGETLDIHDLLYIQRNFAERFEPENFLPPVAASFFAGLLLSRQPSSVLNAWDRLGFFGAYLASESAVQKVQVVTPSPDAKELWDPLGLANLAIHVGALETLDGRLSEKFDAITGFPPINLQRQTRTMDGGVELIDEFASFLMLEAGRLLADDGFLAFIVGPKFGVEPNPKSVRRNLENFGLHLSGLLRMRPGTFPGTGMAFDIAILERADRGALFVAEVPEEPIEQTRLITRLWSHQEGATTSQGRLVSPEFFRGLSNLEAVERAKKLAEGRGLEPVAFNRAVVALNSPRRRGTQFEPFEELPNSVYLPQMASTKATTRQEELPKRLKSYYQLVVDEDIIAPEFLAAYLNTPPGLELRESTMSGNIIPRISKALLEESVLWLPPLADQKQIHAAMSSIRLLRNELNELESRTGERPRRVRDVIRALGRINHEERFEDWLECLPFPLASILRSYRALDQTPKEKYERLIHFFEAFAAFVAMIHISAFKATPALWETQRTKLRQVLKNQNLSFRVPTFGLWRAVDDVFSAELRAMLHDPVENRELAAAIYRSADTSVLEALGAKSLPGLLQRTLVWRNRWLGHSGDVSTLDAEARHSSLRAELEQLREIIGTSFSGYRLIEPRTAEILEDPYYRFRVRVVMGSDPQLIHETIDLRTRAKTGSLYMHSPGHDEALELVKFVQVQDAPQPASYFYNRLEQNVPYFVSYQMAIQSEITDGSGIALKILDELMAETTEN